MSVSTLCSVLSLLLSVLSALLYSTLLYSPLLFSLFSIHSPFTTAFPARSLDRMVVAHRGPRGLATTQGKFEGAPYLGG